MTSDHDNEKNSFGFEFRSPHVRFFYIASPGGKMDASPVKIGISRDEGTLSRRLRKHQADINPDLEFAAVFEWKDCKLHPERAGLPTLVQHTPEDIEVKLKAQLNSNHLNTNGLFRGELFDTTPEQIIIMMSSIDLARSQVPETMEHFNTYGTVKGISVSVRRMDGKWDSLGLCLSSDPSMNVADFACELSAQYAAGEPVQILDLFSPTPSFITIPPNHGILRFSVISQTAMPVSDLKLACLSRLNDMEVVFSDYEYQLWHRYNHVQMMHQMQQALKNSSLSNESDDITL